MKKKTISVTVTYLLISKMGSSESRSELSSMAELTRVQAECHALHEEPFQYQGPLWENRAIYEARAKYNKRSNARRFLSSSSPFFGLFCLVFSSFFLFLFKNKKLSQELYIRVFSTMIDIKLLFIIGI